MLHTSGSVIASCTYICVYICIHIHISIKPEQCRDMADAKRINNEMYCWLLFWARRFRELISGLWFLLASTGFSAMSHSNRKTDEIALAVTGMHSLYDLQWDSLTSESDTIRAEQQPKRWSLFAVKWYFTLLSPTHPPQIREWFSTQHPCRWLRPWKRLSFLWGHIPGRHSPLPLGRVSRHFCFYIWNR